MRNHCKKYAIPIEQYDLEGNFIKKWESASETERQLGIRQQCIVACLKNRTKTAGGYIWKYTNKEVENEK